MESTNRVESLFQHWLEKEEAYRDYLEMITKSGEAAALRKPTRAEIYALAEIRKETITALEKWLEARRS